MDHDSEPDYVKCRSVLISGIESSGHKLDGPLSFKTRVTSPKRKSTNTEKVGKTTDKKRKLTKKKIIDESDEEETTKQTSSKENVENGAKKKTGRTKNKKQTEDISDDEKMETEDIAPGFTAEMMRVKQRMEANKKAKTATKRTALKSAGSSGSSKFSSADLSDVEVIEGTPTPPQNSRKKTHITNGGTPVTPTRSSARSKKTVYYGSEMDMD